MHAPLANKGQAQLEQLLPKKSYSQILNETLRKGSPSLSVIV